MVDEIFYLMIRSLHNHEAWRVRILKVGDSAGGAKKEQQGWTEFRIALQQRERKNGFICKKKQGFFLFIHLFTPRSSIRYKMVG